MRQILLESVFIPSITLGWNTHPRINPPKQRNFRENDGFPYRPILRDPTPEEISVAFESVQFYLSSIAQTLAQLKIPPIYMIYALQEMGESACLLDEIIDEERVSVLSDAVALSITKIKAAALAHFKAQLNLR